MERSTYHSTHERLEFNHREYGQGEYAARLLTNAIVGTWKDIDHGTPPDRSRYVPYMTHFPVQEDSQWFPGPLSHPYPGVSSCRTDAALGGDPRLPVVGLPDCQSLRDFGFPDLSLGLSTDTFEQYGIPVPENYSAHLQTGTVNGSVNVDFPVNVQSRQKQVAVDLGSGGAMVKAMTTNGGVHLKRLSANE